MIAQPGRFGAALQHGGQRHIGKIFLDRLPIELGRIQQVIDECIEPLEIIEHKAVEVAPAGYR